jgi:hypothetical protein
VRGGGSPEGESVAKSLPIVPLLWSAVTFIDDAYQPP